MRSQIAFAWGALGGLVRIRMLSAVKTASNVLVNRVLLQNLVSAVHVQF